MRFEDYFIGTFLFYWLYSGEQMMGVVAAIAVPILVWSRFSRRGKGRRKGRVPPAVTRSAGSSRRTP